MTQEPVPGAEQYGFNDCADSAAAYRGLPEPARAFLSAVPARKTSTYSTRRVSAGERVIVPLLPRGGFVARLEPSS